MAVDETPNPAASAAICAGLVIASQTAGKAARDAIFLSQFHVTKLPALLIASALLSIAAALWMARTITKNSPALVVPLLNITSALLLLGEWLLYSSFPGGVAIAVYVHQSVIGALLVSGFYSVVSERFDPRSARSAIGTIGAGSTLGGILGAVIAERTGALLGTAGVLPVLAGLQLVTGWRVAVLARTHSAPPKQSESTRALVEAMRSLRHVKLLRHLALLVLLGNVAAAFLDYVLKARASVTYSGEDLLRFFAAFYGGIGVLTALVQWTVGRRALETWGIASMLAIWPAAIAVFGAAAAAVPTLVTVVAARGAENLLRNTFFRQSYELLYSPLPAHDKRASKTIIDVGVDRLGDAFGGALVAIGLYAGSRAEFLFLGGAVVLALGVIWVTARVQTSYVEALERGLASRAIDLDLSEVGNQTTRATMLRTIYRLGPSAGESQAPGSSTRMPAVAPDGRVTANPLLARSADLRSGDAEKVRATLAHPLSPQLVAHAIPLLAWNEVAPMVIQALRRAATRSTGQLVDALLDPDEEFAVRRRLPRVLAAARGPRARDGLLAALADPRFEVRYHTARALAIHLRGTRDVPSEPIFAAVRRELEANDQAWQDLRVLDAVDDRNNDVAGDDDPEVAALVHDRANRGLEQVFTLLELVLPAETVRIAFRALHTDDRNLRGTALEYLEQVLPPDIRDRLWPRITEDPNRPVSARPHKDVVAELVRSQAAVLTSLRGLPPAPAKS